MSRSNVPHRLVNLQAGEREDGCQDDLLSEGDLEAPK